MPPCRSTANEPASAATATATSRKAANLGRAAKRRCAEAVDDVNTLGGYRLWCRRESPWRVIRLHSMGTEKLPW
jgi:hypothetical protein